MTNLLIVFNDNRVGGGEASSARLSPSPLFLIIILTSKSIKYILLLTIITLR